VDNLLLAARKARRGKSRKPDVEEFHHRLETHVMRLSEELSSGQWQPGGYHHFEIHEPKRRLISAAPYADRVVHHALCNVLQPALERRFHPHSYSCQIGKGTTSAREQVRRLVNRHRYVLKCDVRKFFDSIDHAALQERLAACVPDAGVRELMRRIIHSHEASSGCGVPIGNLTSQLWGSFLLTDLDHWITRVAGFPAYARYTDDFLIFGNDKAALWQLREEIVTQLAALKLKLAEPKSRLLACAEGVPFCGFRFVPTLRPRVLGVTKRRFEARRTRLFQQGEDIRRITTCIFAWYQFSREGNTHGLRRAYAAGRWQGRRRAVQSPSSSSMHRGKSGHITERGTGASCSLMKNSMCPCSSHSHTSRAPAA